MQQPIPLRQVDLPGRGPLAFREIAGPPHAPTLVLLHGLAATALLNWGPSLGALGRGFRVLAPDHRGHGRGLRPRGEFRLEDCADDAARLTEALGIERFIAVGYSMGGPIAQLVWRRHRARTAGLVLCATAARFAGTEQRRAAVALAPLVSLAARWMPSKVWQEAASRRIEQGVANPELQRLLEEEIAGTDPAAVVEAAAALARFDSRPWLGDIDVPTAVLVTGSDEHVPPRRQEALAAAIPAARTYPVVGNHYVCVARPERFVPVLYEACQAVASAQPVRVIS